MTDAVVDFKPVEMGSTTEIPPDAPEGAWEAQCSVKKAATSKDSFPMLILNWKLVEALTDGNEDAVGGKVADFLVFFPKGHAAQKMGLKKLHSICECLKIEIPALEKIESWDDLADFIGEVDQAKAKIWTTVTQRKDTGEMSTNVLYTAPKGFGGDGEEDDDDEKPPTKKNGKAPAKKNGRK